MAHSSAASYSPYMPPRTPVSSRARSVSAPSTPRLGYTTKSDNIHSCRNHLLHPDSNSDGSTSYASPAHKSAYGTLTTDISGFNSQAMGRPNLIVELSSPSDESCHIITNTASLCKPIAWVWIVGNIVIFGMVVFACLQPYWLVEPSTNASLGILNYCSVSTGDDGVMTCMPYYRRTNVNVSNGQRLVTLSTLPWKAGVVLYIISSILLGISSLLATVCLCASSVSNIERLSLAAGLQQLIAGQVPNDNNYCYSSRR